MNSITKIFRVSFIGALFTALLLYSSIPVQAQSVFNRNDNFDFAGEHYLRAVGDNLDNFNLFIDSDSDFRRFKLRIKRNRLHLLGNRWLANQYRIDMNNDGTWEQGWTISNDITLSYNYPNPPNGISANYTIKIEIQYCNGISECYNRTRYVQITIFSTPRVYVDSDNNSFVQLRDENPINKIPVLMVEGFDALNENFPELYYNLTWNLVNTDLYPNGYEVFILNFANGGRDLKLNADVLTKAIEKVHEICPNYKIAVAGLSMGGPIARYALAKKEQQGGNHNVGLFLSYDSPQIWAHLNPELQDWIKGQDPGTGAIGNLQANLQSVAAKQMMGYNTYDPSHIFREQFYNELNALNGDGYPDQSYNVAVSNGNLVATHGYASVGRDLMTLKINGELYRTVAAVQLDCGTGSMVTDITGRRYGDIFAIPFITIYYELEFYFNPVYHPTWSSLDLVNYIINGATGDITSFDRSKFDDFVVQTTPLEHHELSDLTRNTIMDWLNKNSNIIVNYSLPEGGSVTPDNYQVRILHGIPITIQPKVVTVNGRQITYTFWKWSDGNTDNPRTFYTSHDASVTAIMKGINVSNNQNAFSSNSQRKLVRTTNGDLHKVYESMNKVWYEKSTNNGATWTIENNGKPLSANDAKLPAIDCLGGEIIIVWQEKNGITFKIRLCHYSRPGTQLVFRDVFDASIWGNPTPYSYDAMPVIAWMHKIVVAWKEYSIRYRYGYVGVYEPITWYTSEYGAWIDESDDESTNPTISVKKDAWSPVFHLAWQENSKEIKYCTLTPDGTNIIISAPAEIISTGDTYNARVNPSISVGASGYPTIVYNGKIYEGSYAGQVIQRSKGLNGWGSFTKYGSEVNYPTHYGGISVWSEGSSYINKMFFQGSIKTLSTIGKFVQVSNGPSSSSMYAVSHRNNSFPYDFLTTSALVSISKENSFVNQCGREGIIGKGEAEFYFIIADVTVNDDVIKFQDIEDTTIITSINELNHYLATNTFSLSEASDFSFSIAYGVNDSLKAIEALNDSSEIKFITQLVDANTNEVLGEFDNIIFNINNIYSYQDQSFTINTQGIGNSLVKLRVISDTNFEGAYYLANIITESDVLGKSNVKEMSFTSGSIITSYDLFQNYPNPFNPQTVIKYQIPEDGEVTLKIYDILGKEVTTLVNEQKTIGRYELNFDASNLASGVYIYRIQVNDFVSSKKMVLLK